MEQYQQLSFTFSINRDRGAAGNPFRFDGSRPNGLLNGIKDAREEGQVFSKWGLSTFM